MKKSIGFFFCFLLIPFLLNAQNSLLIKTDEGRDIINKNIYGHFAEHLGRCIYGGIWVGKDSQIPNTRGLRNDVLEALKEMSVPVIRWPGGCFADTYHWKDGIGPAEKRPKFVNTNWGGVVEDNSFGTHEFLDFCELIGAEPYININVGSGTVQEAREWVEYINSDNESPMANLRRQNGREKPWNVKYWGIGNETWGCGGHMSPEFNVDIFKKFATFCPGKFKILSGGTSDDLNWTEVSMKNILTGRGAHLMQGYSYHYYTICHDWSKKGSAVNFDESEWFSTMKKTWWVDENLKQHTDIMDKYDPEKKVALLADEYGNWFDVEPGENPSFLYQQNTLRDAVTAALYLNIFNNHCDRVRMANIAQTVNVLQAVLLTKDNEIVKTPTYYVFKMFKPHQDAVMLPFDLTSADYTSGTEKIKALSVSASKDKTGKIHISIANLDPVNQQEISCTIQGADIKKVSGEIITAEKMNALNDFGKGEEVNIKTFEDVTLKNGKLTAKLPAKSVVMLMIE
ncbi:MAG: alpha-N-arabinofuranosidase [Calditrichaceae bacterium]|nr:alpha-N-arabinofuranosidase [Calditrichaceae bacterium]MBN2710186.1 alpha-N-arabinofuranosidase [Calditrichaceae bacterium]RQV94160.1 MAG: alpha-N-arabinofuranosidase [Calditrichota bacterium]